jgi:hypothetical protein
MPSQNWVSFLRRQAAHCQLQVLPTTLHETSVIETVAASHVICVLSRPRGHLSQG